MLLHASPVTELALRKPAPLAMIWVEEDAPSEGVDGWRLDCGAGDLAMPWKLSKNRSLKIFRTFAYLPFSVMPAKAGIHFFRELLDSRICGNDEKRKS